MLEGVFIIVSILRLFINILIWMIIFRCLLSWIPQASGKIVELVYKITDPFLEPINKILLKSQVMRNMPVDISPLIAIAILDMLYKFLR